MIITQQDRDNYTKLCTSYNALYQTLSRIKEVVNEEHVYTIISSASKKLVGRKDVLYMDREGALCNKEEARIKLSFTGFMKRERWQKGWSKIRAYDMWDYLIKTNLISGMSNQTTKRNPQAFQDLICILKDALLLREARNQELEVITKLPLPRAIELPEGLYSDESRRELVKPITATTMTMLSSCGWTTSIVLELSTPELDSHRLGDITSKDLFIRLSTPEFLDPIFVMLKDAKEYAEKEIYKRGELQRNFDQKYGHYLVEKEL